MLWSKTIFTERINRKNAGFEQGFNEITNLTNFS